MRNFKCEDCGHSWQLPFGQGGRGADLSCPQCTGRNVYRVGSDAGGRGRFRHAFAGWGRGRRRRASMGSQESLENTSTT
jgi:transposase-like protein